MSEFILFHPGADYGAIDLKQNYQKYLRQGLIIAGVLHILGVGMYWASVWLAREDEPTGMIVIKKYSDLGPPPSITNANSPPAIAVSGPAVKPSVGIPVPVPDAEVNPEQTIATQQELSSVGDIDATSGGNVEIKIEDEPPADFVAYEKEPVAIKRIDPKYPEIARRAGVEGTVWLRLWVDKEGKVRKAVSLKYDAEILVQPAIEAAQQWVFTPAMQHNGPVAVWVAIPFRFKLNAN